MAVTLDSQYLSFGIDGDTYGVPVSRVREVLEYSRPTKLPNSERYMKGLINVRGLGIPVIDLRTRFGLPEIDVTADTAILVVEIEGEGGVTLVGAIADRVYEVIELGAEAVEPAPKFGARIDSGFIRGIGKRDDGFIVLIDLEKAFSEAEVRAMEAVAEA